jgi:hypothetical protein
LELTQYKNKTQHFSWPLVICQKVVLDLLSCSRFVVTRKREHKKWQFLSGNEKFSTQPSFYIKIWALIKSYERILKAQTLRKNIWTVFILLHDITFITCNLAYFIVDCFAQAQHTIHVSSSICKSTKFNLPVENDLAYPKRS